MDGSFAMALPAWHAGEREMQRRAGVAERMAEIGPRVLRDRLIEQHRQFYPLLPYVMLGAVDEAGDAWATLRGGVPGFLSSPDPYHLDVAMPRDAADPAEAGLEDGAAVGLLGLDLTTRRRNRLNGRIARQGSDGFTIEVEQSFGNCPQYIQLRAPLFHRDPALPSPQPVRESRGLDDAARRFIAEADTFFVASYVTREDGHVQLDVSHRGGKPGFVRVDAAGVLTIPDFAGNRFFNTLGNMLANPRAGLVFVDFTTGDLLQMTGVPDVQIDPIEAAQFEGAERIWRFTPTRVVHRPEALPLHWSFDPETGWSPEALATGRW